MFEFNKTVTSQPFSVIRAMGMKASKYQNVISLGIGEPDFDTCHSICECASQDAKNGYTHYAPSWGDDELRQMISQKLQNQGYSMTGNNVLITSGAMGGLFCALNTILCKDQDDEVICLAPYFSDYAYQINFAGGKLVAVCANAENGFLPKIADFEAVVSKKSKVLLLNSPANPTGLILPPALLDELAKFAIKHNLLVISDEVYDGIYFTAKPESIATRPNMSERTLVLNSFSKYFAMTGFRVGYAFGPENILNEMVKLVSLTTASVSTIGQRAALAALKAEPKIFEDMAKAFKERVEYCHKRLSALPNVTCNMPQGAFYLFPCFHVEDSEKLALEILDKVQVVTVPGYIFGPDSATKGCLRIAATIPIPKLEEAFDRIATIIK